MIKLKSKFFEYIKNDIKDSANLSSKIVITIGNASESMSSCLGFLFDTISKNKRLNLDVLIRYIGQKVSLGESQYIRCNFGYYRSKYLRSAFFPHNKLTQFDASNNTAFLYLTEAV